MLSYLWEQPISSTKERSLIAAASQAAAEITSALGIPGIPDVPRLMSELGWTSELRSIVELGLMAKVEIGS